MKKYGILLLAVVFLAVLGVVPAAAGPAQGTMHTARNIPIADDTSHLLGLADLNGDGRADVLTVIGSRQLLGILLSNGDGTFRNVPGRSTVGLYKLAPADANGDGVIDLVGFSGRMIATLLGRNDGTFSSAITSEIETLNTGSLPEALDFADFNVDGLIDVVVTRLHSEESIVFGRGNGRFGPDSIPLASGSSHFADFNGDGIPDLVSADEEHHLFVGLGNGDGTFRRGADLEYGGHVGGDINGDGNLDLVGIRSVVTGEPLVITVQLGRGDGTFLPLVESVAPGVSYFASNTVADFDGDGFGDLLMYSICGDTEEYVCHMQLIFGSSDGVIERYEPVGGSENLSVGDVNGDGLPDTVFFYRLPPESGASLSGLLNATLSIREVQLDRRAPRPFRVRLTGSNFDPRSQVFIGDRTSQWSPVVFKSDRKLILKGGAELESLFVAGTPTTIRIVNPDGRETSTIVVTE